MAVVLVSVVVGAAVVAVVALIVVVAVVVALVATHSLTAGAIDRSDFVHTNHRSDNRIQSIGSMREKKREGERESQKDK